jgi:hypothetical protein
LVLAGCSVVGIRSGTEEPKYKVIATLGAVEVRKYSPRLAASTTEPGDALTARYAGFRRLAAYIFGQNIAMTAPVAQAQNIAMTAPVAQERAEGGWIVTFYMPAKYTVATLPKPVDPGVVIHEVPALTYAVYRFAGIPGAAPVETARVTLLKQLTGSDWVVEGPVVDWFYDPPWTLPWARRNEVAVPVAPK